MIPNLTNLTKANLNVVLINAAPDCYALMDYVLEQLQHKIQSNCSYKFNADRFFQYTEVNEIINDDSIKIYLKTGLEQKLKKILPKTKENATHKVIIQY